MSLGSADITETGQTMQHLGDEYLLLMTKSLFSRVDHQRGGGIRGFRLFPESNTPTVRA